ncbi:MAG: hypothetical protein ABEJ05_06775 [Haloglomus sp.]
MPRTDDGPNPDEIELTEAELAALHDLEIGLEHVRRGYGALVTFHHQIGRGMDRIDDARARLREAGRDDLADRLRDEVLPAGAVGDRWSYELVADFQQGLLTDVAAVEADAREALADGTHHLTERLQQRRWRERAAGDTWQNTRRSETDETAETDGTNGTDGTDGREE